MHAWRQILFSEVTQHIAVAFVDRALLSATNFAVGVLLIRQSPADYGLYVLANAAILLAIGVQNALITTPMTVLAPKRTAGEKQHLVNGLAQTQYLIWLPIGLVVALLALLGHVFAIKAEVIEVVLALVVVILLVFMREFIRLAFFVYMRPMAVLVVDAVYGTLFLSAAYFVVRESSALALHAIVAMGIAGLGAGIVGLMLFYQHIGWKFSWDPGLLAITWQHGKWSLMGVVVSWLQNEGFLYMLAGLKGEVDVAHVSASRLLFMPIAMMLSSIDVILKPRGAAWLARGEERRIQQSIILLTGGSLVVALLYICCLLLGQKSLTVFLFREDITGMSSLLTLWGVVSLLRICCSNLSTVLQIFERFDRLFYIGAVSAIASLSIGYWAIHTIGALGSLVGLMVSEIIYLIGMGWWVYARARSPLALPGV